MGQGKLSNTDASRHWPRSLQAAAKASRIDTNSWRPVLIEMTGEASEKALDTLVKESHIVMVLDEYDEQYAELTVSRHPELYRLPYAEKIKVLEEKLALHHSDNHAWQKGSWVYYPWSATLLHILPRELFLELRSTRNRNLITEEEQHILENFNVGCAGMSVGSNAALSIGISGYSQKLKLVDGAVISGTNLNRILANVSDIGLSKSLVIARKLYEMNPYITIDRSDENITSETIVQFFETPWPIDAVVDEIDDVQAKIRLRLEARRRRLPVVMVTDLGDDVMLDVERYDLEPDLPLFHGLIENIDDLPDKELDGRTMLKMAMNIIGSKNAPLRTQESLMQMGRQLAAQPQLGGTAIIAGAVVAYALRQIALGQDISGRSIISLDEHLLKSRLTEDYARQHAASTAMIEEAFGQA